MIRRASAGLLLAATLAACGTVDQAPLDREVAAAVHDGMPADEALRNLQRQGFACSALAGAEPHGDCSRRKGHLFPLVTCIEHVTFPVAAGSVARPPAVAMACIGTP